MPLLIIIAILAALIWCWLRGRHSKMSLQFVERKGTAMNQAVQLHVNVTEVDVAGGAIDAGGNPIVLTNLAGEITTGSALTLSTDDNPADDLVKLATGPTVGDTATVKFTAVGDDGKNYEATADITLVAPEETVQVMTLTFTEVAA